MIKPTDNDDLYVIPAKFRALENLHILFWLLKDIGWCTGFKPLGITMIFPTLLVSIYITWKNRQHISELTHNIAISLWITANAMWMLLEFTGRDEHYKQYCLIPFLAGLATLLYYYCIYLPLRRARLRTSA